MSDKTVLILPGDGIGAEVMAQVKRLIDWFNKERKTGLGTEDGMVGGAAIDAHGVPLTDEELDRAKAADAVLLGAVGGPKWDGLPFEKKPERGLLALRKELGLFANLRPAICFEALAEASSLKRDLVAGLDIMIVRELTGGVYFGEPRGITEIDGGGRRGVNTQVYTSEEIRRVARVAFELARKRNRRVTSAEKANVMESGVLWREEVQGLRDEEFEDIELTHMYADNCAMQLVRRPKQFDVIVTDNLFGDLLSDEAAMLTGSLGMLPSASLGLNEDGTPGKALYEPVHGSAPDIAGQGIANPIACIMSFAMALRYTLGHETEADLLEQAVQDVLADGVRTADIAQEGEEAVGTAEMTDAVLAQLDKAVAKA